MKIIVMCGLPASGKTELAKKIAREENKSSYRSNVHVFDLDVNPDLDSQLLKSKNSYDVYIIDGLLLINNDYIKIRDIFCDYYFHKNLSFEFHYFIPNREACLNNDEGRRSKNSKITIMNAEIEEPNVKILSSYKDKKINVKVMNHETYIKDGFDKFKEQQSISDYLDSDTWSRGGNHCNCWGDDYEIRPDVPPDENIDNFPELNEFIEKICPGLSYELKQEFFEKTVFIEDDSESDYYGGREYKSFFRCNIRRLYELMDERELIVLGQIIK
ncbi:hypothetical protein D3C87_78840 [compost metagenome]